MNEGVSFLFFTSFCMSNTNTSEYLHVYSSECDLQLHVAFSIIKNIIFYLYDTSNKSTT